MTGEHSVDGHMPVSKGLPSTLDGGKEIASLVCLVGLVGSVAILGVFGNTGWALAFIMFLWTVLFLAGGLALRWLRRYRAQERAAEAIEYSAMMDALAQERIAEAKERGDFDRFQPVETEGEPK